MSVVRTRFDSVLAHAGCLLTLCLALAVPSSQAEEQRRISDEAAVEQVAPLSRRNHHEIITELPPLKPYKKGAGVKPVSQTPNPVQSVLDSAKQAERPAPASQTAQPATAMEPPTPVVAAPAAALPQPKPAPLAEAPSAPAATPAVPEIVAVPAAGEKPTPEVAAKDAAPANPPSQSERASIEKRSPTSDGASPAPAAAETKPSPKPAVQVAAETAPKVSTALDPTRLAAIIAEGVKGPAEVRLEDRAVYALPEGRIFLPKDKARELVQAAGHQWDDATIGTVLGATTGSDWIAFVDLLDDGYIKDDGAAQLDAMKLLDGYKASVVAGNEVRARAGAKPLVVTGWVDAPRYDEKHRFVSCVGASAEPMDDPRNGVVNCTSYALGRSGAFRIIVATGAEGYVKLKGEASNIAEAIAYDPGKGYADVDLVKDPIAPYGLIALASGAAPAKQSVAAPHRAAPTGGDRLFNLAGLVVGILGVAGLVARRFMAKKPVPAASQQRRASDANASAKAKGSGFLEAMRSRFAGAQAKSAAKVTGSAPAMTVEAISHKPEQSVSALKKLGALMRKKAPTPNYVSVNADRLTRQPRPASKAVLQGGAPEFASAEADAIKNAPEPTSEPKHELIEPGAAEADALRAREPLRVSA